MNTRAVEWRKPGGLTWHIFIGQKAICSRAYSNGKFQSTEQKPKDNVCGHCLKSAKLLQSRLRTIT